MKIYTKINFGFCVLASDLAPSDTVMVLASGHNLGLDTAQIFKLIMWDQATYPNPADDPQLEVVIAWYTGTINHYNLIRAQEGTIAVAHDTGDYGAVIPTAQMQDEEMRFVPSKMIILSASTGTWTRPPDVFNVYLKMVGPGGYGGQSGSIPQGHSTSQTPGGGGAAGGYVECAMKVTGNIDYIIGQSSYQSDYRNTVFGDTTAYRGGDGDQGLSNFGGHDGHGGTGGQGQLGASVVSGLIIPGANGVSASNSPNVQTGTGPLAGGNPFWGGPNWGVGNTGAGVIFLYY